MHEVTLGYIGGLGESRKRQSDVLEPNLKSPILSVYLGIRPRARSLPLCEKCPLTCSKMSQNGCRQLANIPDFPDTIKASMEVGKESLVGTLNKRYVLQSLFQA